MRKKQSSPYSFHSIAEYYAVMFDEGARLEREGPLLLELLGQTPGQRVVDLACGTGPHARFFAEHGARVTAFDASAEMIEEAMARTPKGEIMYRQGDMRSVEGGPWELAVCLGNSLSLLPSVRDVAKTFESVRHVLAPSGLFLVQILNYAHPGMREASHRVITKTVNGKDVVAVKNLVPRLDRTLLSLSFYAKNRGKYESLSETAVLLPISLNDFLGAALRAGLTFLSAFGGYDKSLFVEEQSSDLLCLFQYQE